MSPYKAQLAALYLDYFNNYLTVGYFAECNGLLKSEARKLIVLGMGYHQEMVEHEQRRKLNKGATTSES